MATLPQEAFLYLLVCSDLFPTFLEIHDKQYDFWHLIVDEITEIPYDGNDHNDSIIGKSP
jgi:hypothetical protein